jgi:hypothetical protein
MSKLSLLLAPILSTAIALQAQNPDQRYTQFGELIITQLSSAPFPHPKRADGHKYDNLIYPADKHYNDSSVAMFIPKGYRQTERVDFVVHFHGWWNNVDSVLRRFQLIEQFSESEKNAILIVPQGPRNSPDSFGGKLEDAGGFERFMSDIIEWLFQQKKTTSRQIGNIILSGHSGGYHVISFILMRGGLTDHIREVFLFDALYGQTEKYVYWLDHHNGKLISIYTKDGGTKDETEALISDLEGWGIPYLARKEADVTPEDLRKHRLVFLYTDLQHNEVVDGHRNFRDYLKASALSEREHR